MKIRSISFFLYLLLLGLILSSLPYLFWSSNYFVADDWPVLARSRSLSLWQAPQWFWQTQFGWYRPLFDLYMAVCWRIFGLSPTGYHLLSIAWYAAVSVMVGIVGWLLTSNRNVSLLSVTIFALHSCHSTVVMWISSANELLAGFSVLAGIACYICYRQRRHSVWLLFAAIATALAITAKETALFLPLAFILYDLLFYQKKSGRKLSATAFLPSVVLFLLVLAHLALHPPTKASSLTFDFIQLGKNIVYYLAMQLLTISTRFEETLASPISLVTLCLAAISLMAIGLLSALSYSLQPSTRKMFRALIFAIGLTLLALAPVMFEIWERTALISSAGVALTVSLLFMAAWDYAASRNITLRIVVAAALVIWISANAFTLLSRNYRWVQAGEANKAVIEQLAVYTKTLPEDTEIWLVNLPDRYGNAFAFRNTFPPAAEMVGYPQNVNPVLDIELAKLSPAEREGYFSQLQSAPNTTVLYVREDLSITAGMSPAQ